MRTVRLATFCLTAFALFAADGRAQVVINGSRVELPQLPGMARGQVKTGTGRVVGRVVAAETGTAVRRAQVRISGNDVGARSALTDANGRYEFSELPAGRFTLTAQKSGYMTVQYGQTRPFESGKSIELADGQVVEKADIAMPRGSVISGRIVDEFGDPIADVSVSAMRSVWSNGRRRLQQTGRTAQTNDLGQYRLFGLAPGEYYVSATYRGPDMAIMEMAMVTAISAGTSGPSGSTPNSGYAPTYYPGTTSGADAQRLTVAVGQEAQGTDFALLPVRFAKITGTVISSDGKPTEGAIVSAVPRTGGDVVFGPGGSARTDKNGNFTLSHVTPGDYTLQTRALQIMTSSDGGNSMVFTMTRVVGPEGGNGSEPESGAVPVSVSGEDLSNVIIVTTKGSTLSGRLTFEGGKPASAGNVRIMAMPLDSGDGPSFGGGAGVAKPEDGSFELKGLTGARAFRALGLPAGWSVKSVTLNGQDVTDTGVEFRGGEAVTGLEIVVTSKTTAGQRRRERLGRPHGEGLHGRRLFRRSGEVDGSAGALHLRRAARHGRPLRRQGPPARRVLCDCGGLHRPGRMGDPELLDRLKTRATHLDLDEGATKALDLKLER